MGKLTRHQIRTMRTKQRWGLLWKNEPAKMEAHRSNATAEAAKEYARRADLIRDMATRWPPTMTTEQFNQRCQTIAQTKPIKPRCVRNKIIRLGILTYSPDIRLWVNHISSVASNLEDDINDDK
ncbi:hypothetical protein UFOVP1118_19 [uncultured Caudovirales phage]|uniref:Uncharacterized protein n=1 Tax=uncultured Caudovirales phage TaxID=2100421 RepID=A0A6J5QVN4_9CAUD|nr:hypothetical protein UFOVP1118_19 [uncultured Caudovirales phage]